MPKVIVFRQKGDWKKSRRFLKRCSNLNLDELLDRYGQEGVEALAKATPKDTGKTAASWSYTVTKGKESIAITWRNSNIVDGVMHKDFLVSFSGVDFPCVDRGFAREQSVQVVVRPEDLEVVSPVEGQLVGVVNDVIFKGVHFEMHVECEGREWLIHSTRACTPGETIGMRIGPNEIHIMARSEG